jgi:hypothetical protein
MDFTTGSTRDTGRKKKIPVLPVSPVVFNLSFISGRDVVRSEIGLLAGKGGQH